MQAALIRPGEFYAYLRYPPKGIPVPLGAIKVQVNQVRKVKQMFDKNARTIVDVVIVEDGRELSVRSRSIIGFWNEYENEVAYLKEEIKKKKEESRRYWATNEAVKKILIERFSATFGVDVSESLKVKRGTLDEYFANFWQKHFAIEAQEIEQVVEEILREEEKV